MRFLIKFCYVYTPTRENNIFTLLDILSQKYVK